MSAPEVVVACNVPRCAEQSIFSRYGMVGGRYWPMCPDHAREWLGDHIARLAMLADALEGPAVGGAAHPDRGSVMRQQCPDGDWFSGDDCPRCGYVPPPPEEPPPPIRENFDRRVAAPDRDALRVMPDGPDH